MLESNREAADPIVGLVPHHPPQDFGPESEVVGDPAHSSLAAGIEPAIAAKPGRTADQTEKGLGGLLVSKDLDVVAHRAVPGRNPADVCGPVTYTGLQGFFGDKDSHLVVDERWNRDLS